MLADTERSALIEVIRAFPQALATAVAGLTDEQLTTAYLADEWTVAQIVHHTADSHMNSFIRLKLILSEDNPTVKPYDEGAWALLPDANHTRLDESLDLLHGLHRRWTALLHSLTPAQRQRTGIHPDIGAITPDDLVVIYAEHCRAHLDQLRRVLQAGGVRR